MGGLGPHQSKMLNTIHLALDGRLEAGHGEKEVDGRAYAPTGVIRFIASGMASVPSGT